LGIKLILFWCLLLITQYGKTQAIPESVSYINYTINDGLPSNETYDIFQDSKGYLWIGTDNGVVKYDGHSFKTYTTNDGLTDNTIFRIQEDYKGRVWFMTYNRKLCYLEDGVFQPYVYNDQFINSIKHIRLGEIINDFRIDTNNNVQIVLTNLSQVHINSHGEVSVNALSHHHPKRKKMFRFKNDSDFLALELTTNYQHENFSKFLFSNITDAVYHYFSNDSIIAINNNKGLNFYDKKSKNKIRSIFHKYTITGLTVDFEGGYWFTTINHGILYVPNFDLTIYRTENYENTRLNSIIPLKNNLAFHLKCNDLLILDDSLHLFEINKNISLGDFNTSSLRNGIKFESPIILKQSITGFNSIIKYDSNKALCPSNRGLIIIDFTEQKYKMPESIPGQKTVLNFDTSCYSITWLYNKIDGDSFFYGLPDKKILNRVVSSSNPKIFKILNDSKNNIWLATMKGLFNFERQSESLKKIDHSNDLFSNRIEDIIETDSGHLVLGTKTKGLFIWDRYDNSLESINETHNIPHLSVNHLVYDSLKKNIWAATNKGVQNISSSNSNYLSKLVLNKYDLVQSSNILQIAFLKNNIFFTYDNGIGRIPLKFINKRLPPPFLYFQSIYSNGIKQQDQVRYEFSFDSNNIEVNITGISYKSQNDLIYKYQLLPVNTQWQTTSNSNILFNALAPEDYTLKIKAINIDGIESKVKTIQFSITPAFWMTWWFKISVVIIALLIGYRFSMRTIQAYKSQAELQQSLSEMQIMSLQSKMNPHFIFNSLNSIQNYILKNEKQKANEYLLEFSKLIRTTLKNSNSPSISLAKELETLNLYVNLEKKRILKDFKYSEIIDPLIDIQNCIIPSLLIQPYIENSIWHGKVYSHPKGEISLKILLKKETLFFTITDNGIGIKNAESSKINKSKHESVGSAVTKKRIELLAELNNEMSKVTISELDTKQQTFKGTIIKFSTPYILKSPTN